MFLYLATDRASSAVSAERRLVSYWHTPLFESPRLQNMASSEEIQLQAGLYKTIMRTGNGTQLQINDKVTVHCTGFINSDPPTKFWSTKDPGQQPFTFNVGIGQVIQGWDYGCLSMTIGEEASLRIAPELGYGKDGFPAWNIPPNAELLFEIKVLSVEGK